jgi:hypothetical protein
MVEMKIRRNEEGYYETEHNGGVKSHGEHLGKALMHVAKKMEPESDHLHVEASEHGMVQHGVVEGKTHGPHEHESMEETADCPDCGMGE